MSYVRWSNESDVYCYRSTGGFITMLTDGREFCHKTEEEMFENLKALKAAGVQVPDYLLDV